MGFLSKVLGESVFVTVDISFHKNGEINIGIVRHEENLTHSDILELFCNYYVKTIYDIGNSPVSEMMISSFDQLADKFTNDENFTFDLIKVAKQIETDVNFGFDIQDHLKIQKFSVVTNKTEKAVATHKIEFLKTKKGGKYLKTHPAAWLGKIYIPLALFAFFNYLNEAIFRKDRELKLLFGAYLKGLHDLDQINMYYKNSGLIALSQYTEAFFQG